MKKLRHLLFAVLTAALLLAPARTMHAQQPTPHAAGRYERMDAPETNSEEEGYRHSHSVEIIARTLHVSTETAARIFEDFNSGVLILAILYGLFKWLPKTFRKRSDDLQKELIEAHTATEDANRRLSAVEARLSKLDSEIEAFRHQSEHEAAEDEKRIHATLEAERQRIVASAEQEIEAAGEAAQRELKHFAAALAIDRATHKIQLTPEADHALIGEFTRNLAGRNGGSN